MRSLREGGVQRRWGKESHVHRWLWRKGPIPALGCELCIDCGKVKRWGASSERDRKGQGREAEAPAG